MLKSIYSFVLVALFITVSFSVSAQHGTMKKMKKMDKHETVKTINLEQTAGEFTIKSLTLSPGDYQFAIANNGVDHEVGFVLAPKGKVDQPNHIKEAYVKAPVKEGTTGMTSHVHLHAGEYVYFCPLNPTEQYPLTVK